MTIRKDGAGLVPRLRRVAQDPVTLAIIIMVLLVGLAWLDVDAKKHDVILAARCLQSGVPASRCRDLGYDDFSATSKVRGDADQKR